MSNQSSVFMSAMQGKRILFFLPLLLVICVLGPLYFMGRLGDLIPVPSPATMRSIGFVGIAMNVVALATMWLLGWFKALKVGNAVPFPIKIGVWAGTAFFYVLAMWIWIPLVQSWIEAAPGILKSVVGGGAA